jgi:uncharacterized protein
MRVNLQHITAMARRIAREFDPDRIILYGSRASGRARPDSDVDLLVILPFDGNGFDVSTRILEKLRPELPVTVDVQARRPDEAKRRYREWDPLIREAVDRGKVLYERNRPRVARKGGRRLRQRATRA